MRLKAITGDPTIGKKHVIVLTIFNLVPIFLYIVFWIMVIYTDIIPVILIVLSFHSLEFWLGISFFLVLGYVLLLLKINIARIIMETLFACVGIGALILLIIGPVLPFLILSLICLLDFAVLFFDKHIYAYCLSRKTQHIDAETGMPVPLI